MLLPCSLITKYNCVTQPFLADIQCTRLNESMNKFDLAMMIIACFHNFLFKKLFVLS